MIYLLFIIRLTLVKGKVNYIYMFRITLIKGKLLICISSCLKGQYNDGSHSSILLYNYVIIYYVHAYFNCYGAMPYVLLASVGAKTIQTIVKLTTTNGRYFRRQHNHSIDLIHFEESASIHKHISFSYRLCYLCGFPTPMMDCTLRMYMPYYTKCVSEALQIIMTS